MDVVIRAGSVADLEEVNAERVRLGWMPATWWMAPLLADGSGLLLCARRGARLVGCGSAALFGDYGFIGNMITVEDERRRGTARQVFEGLMRWLCERGARRIELEATEMGRPLYARHFGFEDRWQSRSGAFTAGRGADAGKPVAPAMEGDWAAIAALDRCAYGSDRGAYLRAVGTAPGHRNAVIREGEVLSAFGVALPGRLGPIVARSEAAAEAVAGALLAGAEGSLTVTIGGNEAAWAMWERLGFTTEPSDVRMGWGSPPSDDRSLVYALLVGGIG